MNNRYGRLASWVYNLDKPVGRSFGDVEYYRQRLRDIDGPILEPAVGNGRIYVPLRESGVSIEGFDASDEILATFVLAVGFVGALPGFRGLDSGEVGAPLVSSATDLLLLGAFALQHSVMARQRFKAWWTRFIPRPAERSTYVLAATALLALLVWQWRPLPDPVWSVDAPAARIALWAAFWAGWAAVLASTFLIDHLELFGLRQAFAFATGRVLAPPAFRTPGPYRYVRHPLYFGFVLAFWATPDMTVGHLLFAAAATGYILVGIFFEERDLTRHFGEVYRRYRREVPMLIPLRLRRRDRG